MRTTKQRLPLWAQIALVVVGVLVVGVLVVVPVEGLGVVAFFVVVFFLAGFDVLLAGCVAAGVFAGASRTLEPTGVGARPIESREIALAARPTATARQSPTTARIAVRAVLVMATPSWSRPGRPPARAPARRWQGSAARLGCRRRRGR